MMNTNELTAKFHNLLGAYIAKTTHIENRVDRTIASFFNVEHTLSRQFQWWVMFRMDFARKLEVLRHIIEALDKQVEFKAMTKRLVAMMEQRNELAHGQYSQLILFGDEGLEGLTMATWHRKSKTNDLDNMKQLDLDALEKEIVELDGLLVSLDELFKLAHGLYPSDENIAGVMTHADGNLHEVLTRLVPQMK